MPVGLQRINARQSQQPNERIVFIKPLPGPDADTAHDFLSRVAAISMPVMRAASIAVTTLEEHEPNREFLGRNFNAGEIIQLVLKSKSGRWLPVGFVQSVMMHELAHCLEMNHGRGFWKKNNEFRAMLKDLNGKGYTGEGIWGRGRALYGGQLNDMSGLGEDDMPKELCGGTYRSRRRRKRKRNGSEGPNQLSHAERKQRRIEKKFGVDGQSLGDDEETRILMEKKAAPGKPRVARSKRGRDLRAAAALLRFEQDKNRRAADERARQHEQQFEDGSGEDSYDFDASADEEDDPADSSDAERADMVRVCDEADPDLDEDARKEMQELGLLSDRVKQDERASSASTRNGQIDPDEASIADGKESLTPSTAQGLSNEQTRSSTGAQPSPGPVTNAELSPSGSPSAPPLRRSGGKPRQTNVSIGSVAHNPPNVWGAAPPSEPFRWPTPPAMHSESAATRPTTRPRAAANPQSEDVEGEQICSVCSLGNDPLSLTCAACANVLDRERLPLHWTCASEACSSVGYANSDDAGVCGLCGVPKRGEASN